MRKLASIQKIESLTPIDGADRIVLAKIMGWQVVVGVDDFKVGDLCVYFEIDSKLPDEDWAEMLRPHGFKVKTIKLRGQISQGLALPLSKFPKMWWLYPSIGLDLTDKLQVYKIGTVYKKPKTLLGKIRSSFNKVYYGFVKRKTKEHLSSIDFPSYLIPKTDEPRIQSNTYLVQEGMGRKFYVSEKLDGSSITIINSVGEFFLCTRNFRLSLDYTFSENDIRGCAINLFTKVSPYKEAVEKLMSKYPGIGIQGEMIGNVQGNKYKLDKNMYRVFHVYDIVAKKTVDLDRSLEIVKDLGLEWVPILEEFVMEPTHKSDYFVKYAEGKSKLQPKQEREGIVVRTVDSPKISFKAISAKFLLKHQDQFGYDNLDE